MLLEKILDWVAPYDCLVCGQEGLLLCQSCQLQHFPVHTLHTEECNDSNAQGLKTIFWYAPYEEYVKELVQRLKFGRTPQAAEYIAYTLLSLPTYPYDCIVPVRTSSRRQRQRGYDQTLRIAKIFADKTHLPLCDVLWHKGTVRQLGSTRAQRQEQIRNIYYITKPQEVFNKSVLLIDDVMTTGATLHTVAGRLRNAGARSVDGLVFARA